ncbi:MAG: hypothetical protein NZ602_15250, partial [Thermoguttaceae bacterium]|nr:hypothetical protein [Thermoguttaceae bacterium]
GPLSPRSEGGGRNTLNVEISFRRLPSAVRGLAPSAGQPVGCPPSWSGGERGICPLTRPG